MTGDWSIDLVYFETLLYQYLRFPRFEDARRCESYSFSTTSMYEALRLLLITSLHVTSRGSDSRCVLVQKMGLFRKFA